MTTTLRHYVTCSNLELGRSVSLAVAELELGHFVHITVQI